MDEQILAISNFLKLSLDVLKINNLNISYIDIKNLTHMIQCPVIMVTGLKDNVCPSSTQFAIYNRIKYEKTINILSEFCHQGMNVFVNDLIYDYIFNSTIIKN
ncbi:acetylxylan esterase [Enterococcus sp. RIT-PI-f]|uniref:acetylxylan esterase n=1 Tax=Enterococcus sp. RIT-PI-f TaxID=1690244 RepID=UPI0035624E5E